MNKDKLAEIIREHKKWLDGDGGSRPNLSWANLSWADLSRAKLSGANILRANLSGADLLRADLSGADLSRANLSRAKLSGANISGADLSRANLSGADLSGAKLLRANLSGADLSRANLSGADLSRADLSWADLSRANLSGADLKDTMLAGINWLAYVGIVPNKSGVAYAYKMTKADGSGCWYQGIDYTKATNFEVKEIDTDVNIQCSYGINLGTFGWCLNNYTDKTYRLFMFKFNVKDAVCPIGSDGQFRVKKCTKMGECDWKGNLLPRKEA